MGLLKHLLFWPVTGPAALAVFSLRKVEGVVRQELTDDARVKEDLMALQMQLEIGDVDLDEYERREAELMQRLREAREWREQLGMEEKWSPLSYSRSAEDGGGEPQGATEGGGEPDEWPPSSPHGSPPDSCSS